LVFGPAVGLASSGNTWPTTLVAGAASRSGKDLRFVRANGSVSGFGATFGGAQDLPLTQPITGMAATPTGNGYWLVAGDGGIFTFGDARFYGSMGAAHLNQPVFSMAATKNGRGYWLVASDGGIFTFGNAHFYGSLGGRRLNQPIVGITATPSGKGYRMVARDGAIFDFGDAKFYGSLGGRGITDVVGMAPTPTGKGYWILRELGSKRCVGSTCFPVPTIYHFGDARNLGAAWCCTLPYPPSTDYVGDPVVAIIANAIDPGYAILRANGELVFGGRPPGTN
jgi:hypothetical protein